MLHINEVEYKSLIGKPFDNNAVKLNKINFSIKRYYIHKGTLQAFNKIKASYQSFNFKWFETGYVINLFGFSVGATIRTNIKTRVLDYLVKVDGSYALTGIKILD